MKKLIILIATIAICLQTNILHTQEKVKGGYKECTIYYYKYNSGKSFKDSKRKIELRKFNNNGKIKESVFFHPRRSSEIDYPTRSKLDVKNMKLVRVTYKSDGTIDQKIISTFDQNGNLIKNVWYNADGEIDNKSIFEYDNNDNLIGRFIYNNLGKIETKVRFKYDHYGNLLEKIEYNDQNKPEKKSEYVYK